MHGADSMQRDRLRTHAIAERFDRLSSERTRWQEKARYYYEDQLRYLRFLVPGGLKLLEVGCGLGDQLAALDPKRGLGIDLSAAMIKQAVARHPDIEFRAIDVDQLDVKETFDVILLLDVIGHLLDVEFTLKKLRRFCEPHTRVIVVYYNFLWEPLLRMAEQCGLKMPQQQQNWLSSADIRNLLHLADYEVVKTQNRFLIPKKIPLLASLVNRFLIALPGLNRMCLAHYVVARTRGQEPRREYSVSIIVPCRNEKGNIEGAMARMPSFGTRQELIFVDGHSQDGTVQEIERLARQYPDKQIQVLIQEGHGKGDAVRSGFDAARGDILMILDADLTMPPEDLTKFYDAIVSGQGELIIGSRLVYPMEQRAMRLLNLLGNKFFSMAFSWLLGERIKDTLCGTKVLFRRDYERIAANRGYFGDFDPFGDFDLLFGASKLNLKILEVPIRYQERTYGTTNIHRFEHGWLLFKMTVYGFLRLKAV
jgi:ubiquinone/menaquinone biosynthesis C-methylase UbiE